MEKKITVKSINERKNAINIAGILRESFPEKTDYNRVRTKIQREKPELTKAESERIQQATQKMGITFI